MTPNKNAKIPSESENLAESTLGTEARDMTFGHPQWATGDFELWWKWAKSTGHEDVLELLFHVFHLDENEIKQVPFVDIFDTLSTPYSLNILESWSNESELCKDIYQLILEKSNAVGVFSKEIQNAAPVSNEFSSKLAPNKHYLLLRFVSNRISPESDNYKPIILLTVWLLIHAIDRMLSDVLWDKRLKSISSYLIRFVKNNSGDVSDHLWSMLRHFEVGEHIPSFQNLNRLFINRINAETTRDDSSRRFINVVMKVASNDDEDSSYVPESSVILNKRTYQYSKGYDLTKDEVQTLPFLAYYSNEEDEDENYIEYAEAPVNEDQSYTYQKLSAKSVFLTQAEYLYNLPWSWNRLTEFEEKKLIKWIKSTWKSTDERLHFLATVTWIAMNTGRTLMRVLGMAISDEPEREWTLNLTRKSLMRIPPLRNNSWYPKTGDDDKWIYSTAEFNEIKLPESSRRGVEKVGKSFEVIGKYWESISDLSIESIFNEQMIGALERVKSGFLSNYLSQQCFEETGDKNLAQMIGFHPQQGLPGAFAYGSWKSTAIKKITNNVHQCRSAENKEKTELIAFGSRVNIKEHLLKDEIENAYQKIIDIDKIKDPVTFHNYYITYLMIALWAGTGTRPVSDCFESPLHFDLDNGFVFINDKACDERRNGRLAPIPDFLINLLKGDYLRHLALLSDGMATRNNQLSDEIRFIVNGKPSGKLPYFFFIDEKTLDWQRVNEKKIKQHDLFYWPLKSNLFRQRIAKTLPDLGVENEVVNAWLGHKDAAIDTYGDYSIRVFIDDLRKEKAKINTSFDILEFKSLSTWDQIPDFSNVKSSSFTNKVFGINRRIEKREIEHQKIKENTHQEISDYLNGRELSDLEQVEFETLEKQLMSSPGGLVRPHAFIRLSVLHALFDEIWQEELKKFNITRRYAKFDTDLYSVGERCPANYLLFQRLNACFTEDYRNIQASRITVTDSKLLAMLAMMFENRICYPKLLRDIYNGNNFRLVKYKKQFYFEYSENLDVTDSNSPVERHRVTAKTAHLLNNLLGSRKKNKPKSDLFESLCRIVNQYYPKSHIENKTKIEKIISVFSKVIDSANYIELPGVICGYLSGRVTSTSLNWIDWVRLDQDKILNVNNDVVKKKTNIVDEIFEQETIKHNSSVLMRYEKDELLVAANEYINDIKLKLKEYSENNINAVLRDLRKVNTQYADNVSPSILLLGKWILSTIEKGKKSKSDTHAPYSESTIDTYFSSLTSTFVELAYNTDLLTMNSEEVTELYANFIDSIKKDIEYKADRLLDFHDFCKKHDVEEPVWEELSLPNKKRMSSPGIITENDYENALNLISASKSLPEDMKHYMALLLFLCFRFGLRSMEAIGLLRKDCEIDLSWLQDKDWDKALISMYILVANNALRKLKTKGSRRIVPLLFEINKQEKDIIKCFFYKFEPLGLKGENEGLFTGSTGDIVNNIDIIRKTLIKVLRQVTGNRHIVNHHLRHSFSNVTSMPLYSLKFDYWDKLLNTSQSTAIRNIALGKNNTISTRSTMCSARLLGHTFPKTQAISYQHFIDEWANTCVDISNVQSDKKLSRAIEIDKAFQLTKIVNTDIARDNIPEFRPLSFLVLTTLLSLVSSGKSFQLAGEKLSINPESISVIDSVFENINDKVYSKKSMLFLEHIPRSAWKRLYLMMEKLERNKLPEIHPILNVDNIGDMIGKTRQITLHHEDEFRLLKHFNQFFDIDDSDITATSFKETIPQMDLAKLYGLDIDLSVKRDHLDIWSEVKEGGRLSDNRINVIFNENNHGDIRNSYQYVACLLVFYFMLVLQGDR